LDILGMEIRNCQFSFCEIVTKNINKVVDQIFLTETIKNKFDLFVIGSIKQIGNLIDHISLHKNLEELDIIKNAFNNFVEYHKKRIILSKNCFYQNQSYIMGILNITPDSFSDGGKYLGYKDAVNKALEMIKAGVKIIDIGGESSRPGAENVNEKVEINRIIPVVEEIIGRYPELLISVDTTKAKVAEAALASGAKIINDISAFSFDPEILDVVKEYNASLVIMHMKGTPQTMQIKPYYDEVISEIYNFLQDKIYEAKEKGISELIIDPGIGFGKRVEDNYEIVSRLSEFKSLGYPILIGLSRKSFLGKSLNLQINDRDYSTMVLESFSICNGAVIIRTHNVALAKQVQQLMEFYTKLKLSEC
jgi:dihydropteroate synthase